MRKTLFSVLPLLVFLGPSYVGLPSFLGLFSGPSADVQTLRASKEEFLQKGGEFTAVSSAGEPLKVSVVRPNYVNTAVRVTDARGRELQPLVVRYPVEKGGKVKEVAYYSSAHPAVEDDDVVRAGGEYVRERLDEAARRLAAKGERIDPAVID